MFKEANKTIVIFIYGFISTGKLTVAKKIKEKTKYKLLHNHLIIDLFNSLFSESTPIKSQLRQDFHIDLINKLTKSGVNLICTHAYSSNFVSLNGVSDTDFIKNIQKNVKKSGGIFIPVYLYSTKEKIIERVSNSSRKSYGKLTDKKITENLLNKNEYTVPAPIKDNICIDTTKISSTKATKIILEEINKIIAK